MVVTWRSDFGLHCVVSNFARRRWREAEPGEAEDVYWASVDSVRRFFQPDGGARLEPHQLINHYPNHGELSRKDLLVKNLKRYQKAARKEGGHGPGEAAAALPDILPATFILPTDMPLFVEEFRRQPHTTWIVKPANRAQVRGPPLPQLVVQIRQGHRRGHWMGPVQNVLFAAYGRQMSAPILAWQARLRREHDMGTARLQPLHAARVLPLCRGVASSSSIASRS